jgi:GTP-binding protein
MFIDQVRIYVQAGKGGNGVIHFRREKYVPRGGPDGGDGGKGGDVILKVIPTLNTLSSYRYRKEFRAQNGANGGKSNMTGRSGDDLMIPVPPGTIIYDDDNGETLGDLVESGQQLVIAQGGRGGRGNARFASSVRKAPRVAERGEPGTERNLRLDLKLLADIGIIGIPNAGKSTFLAAVTNAQPKIAAYPYTTLEPNLGVANLDDETCLVLADIPGLIEGAHQGVGLGHDFLRHIQRTRILIHLLDGLSDDPLSDFTQINSELALFDPALAEKPQIVAINKIDLPQVRERLPMLAAEFKKYLKESGKEKFELGELFHISALARTNLRDLLYRTAQLLLDVPPVEMISELPLYRVESDPQEFAIKRTSDGWRISGKSIERAAEMTYWEHEQSVRRFQRILEALGIDEALRDEGVQSGDTVLIRDYELEWQD